MSKPFPVVILYGSQTGAAQSIAEGLQTEAVSRGFDASVQPLNSWKKAGFEKARVVVLVCSTTGNGDPPDNAARFWRHIRKRTHPDDLLLCMRFTVLGLGDTNYDRFCAVSKYLDKRLRELGAQHFCDPAWADEAMGLEGTVEPWSKALWAHLRRACDGQAPVGTKGAIAAATAATSPHDAAAAAAAASVGAGASSGGAGAAVTAGAPTSAAGHTADEPARSSPKLALTLTLPVVKSTVEGDASKTEAATASTAGVAGTAGHAGAAAAAAAKPLVELPRRPGLLSFEEVVPFSRPEPDGAADTPCADRARHPARFPRCLLGMQYASSSSASSSTAAAPATPSPDKSSTGGPAEGGSGGKTAASGSLDCGDGAFPLEAAAPDAAKAEAKGPPGSPALSHSTTTVAGSTAPPGEDRSNPVLARVSAARYLTTPAAHAEGRRVVHMELDVSDLGLPSASHAPPLNWVPGDAIGVICPNEAAEVEGIAARLRLDPEALVYIDPLDPDEGGGGGGGSGGGGAEDGGAGAVDLPSPSAARRARRRRNPTLGMFEALAQPCSIRHVLSTCVDIATVPKKALLRLCAEYCSRGVDRDRLLYLCGRSGSDACMALLERQGAGLYDLLSLFPSCAPPLPALLSVLPPHQPRYYSIACSPFVHRTSIHVAFTAVEYVAGGRPRTAGEGGPASATGGAAAAGADAGASSASGGSGGGGGATGLPRSVSLGNDLNQVVGGVRRRGLCTSYLEHICAPHLAASGTPPPAEVIANSDAAIAAAKRVASEVVRAAEASMRAGARRHSQQVGGRLRSGSNASGSRSGGGVGGAGSPEMRGAGAGGGGVDAAGSLALAMPALDLDGGGEEDAAAGRQRARAEGEVRIAVFLKRTRDFHLPGSTSVPLLMIGPGTGVAPFVGFLQHRAAQRRAAAASRRAVCSGLWRTGFDVDDCDDREFHPAASMGFGHTHLFFGCRRREHDYLYGSELEALQADGTLSRLHVAFSRQFASKVYVQHHLRAHGKHVASILLHEGGRVYVCGDGQSMARDVHAALADVLQEHGPMTAAAAQAVLKDLADRHRYVRDIW